MNESWRGSLDRWAQALRAELTTVYYVMRHPDTPWPAKAIAAVVIGYALSPVDLIPDFIPIVGYLDDLILVPLGLALVLRLVPASVLQDCRQRACRQPLTAQPLAWIAAGIILLIWAGIFYLGYCLIVKGV
ncbi:MAG TPA: YkvA family protein [Patescibacteria group bacterium]|nr:YkvA family protein [Patescibacteria group bacterium]